MKKISLILFLLSSFYFFGQEKEVRPFIDPPRTTPRFVEDQHLSEKENKEIFSKKISNRFNNYIHNNDISKYFDSTYKKIYFSFEIDSLGYCKFHKIFPEKLIHSKLVEDLTIIVDSLPRFIPATENNKPVKIYYSIPIVKK
ncbi:MAG: hypothetical protein R2821_01720 [Flavobacteriaceae bacterium]